MGDHVATVGHQLHDLRKVAAVHHPEIEAAREATLTPVDHDCAGRLVGFRLVDRGPDRSDQFECQGVRLAIVEVQHHHGAASFDRKRIGRHARKR